MSNIAAGGNVVATPSLIGNTAGSGTPPPVATGFPHRFFMIGGLGAPHQVLNFAWSWAKN